MLHPVAAVNEHAGQSVQGFGGVVGADAIQLILAQHGHGNRSRGARFGQTRRGHHDGVGPLRGGRLRHGGRAEQCEGAIRQAVVRNTDDDP